MEQQARAYLDQIPFWTRKKNTLEQVRDFLAELGNPDDSLRIIHVAGTNGKGSVCADLTAVLLRAGYRVGTFISPHLTDVKERFLFDGSPAPEETFEKSFENVRAVTEKMCARGYAHPTFFEFVFLMAMDLYGREKPDWVVLETGLGGLLDTTNVIRSPKACVITSISLDHTAYLGTSIPEIAMQKAGIIKAGVPVIFDDTQPEASAVIAGQAERMGSACYPVNYGSFDPAAGVQEREAKDIQEQDAADRNIVSEVKFSAPYQAQNALLALRTIEVLVKSGEIRPVADQTKKEALSHVCWPGRMQKVREDVWLDGAHNPGGISAFIEAVRAQKSEKNIQLLFAAVSDKDYREMVKMLCESLHPSAVTVVHIDSARATDEHLLAGLFRTAGCNCVEQYPSAGEALEAALAKKGENDRLYVVGSLYLIGEIQRILNSMPEAVCEKASRKR